MCDYKPDQSLVHTNKASLIYFSFYILFLTKEGLIKQTEKVCHISVADLYCRVQLTLVISTSVISNNRLSRRDNLIPVLV